MEGSGLTLKELGRKAQQVRIRGLNEDSLVPPELERRIRKIFQRPALVIVISFSFDEKGSLQTQESIFPLFLK